MLHPYVQIFMFMFDLQLDELKIFVKLLSSAFSLLNNVKEYRQAEIAKCDCAIQPYPWASYSTAKVGKVIEEGTT